MTLHKSIPRAANVRLVVWIWLPDYWEKTIEASLITDCLDLDGDIA